MKRVTVTMPKWPAYLMGAFAAACAYPAFTAPAPVAGNYGVTLTKPASADPTPTGMAEGAAAAMAKS